jgi:glycosyltransferase involved in cell wall biosynthesis
MSVRLDIAIPTYNRRALLARTTESILSQTFRDFRLLISDNASTDDTPELCRALAEADPRVTCLRQPENVGLTENINRLVAEMTAPLVMLLADDDWLAEPEYLERCVGALEADDAAALAVGSPQLFRDDGPAGPGDHLELTSASAAERVESYFAHVGDNSMMFAMMRRDAAATAFPMRDVLAGDWLVVGAAVARGKALMLPSATMNRSVEGTSTRWEEHTKSKGGFQAFDPYAAIAWMVLRDVGWRSPAYRDLGTWRRLTLAVRCSAHVIRRFWHSVWWSPIAAIVTRPRIEPVYRALRDRLRRLR